MAFWLAAVPPISPHIFPTWRPAPTTATVFKWVQGYSDDIFICHLSASLQFNSPKQSMSTEFYAGGTASVEKPKERDHFPVTHTWQEIREIGTWATVTCRKDDR